MNGERLPWSATAFCEISFIWWESRYERRFGMPLTDHCFFWSNGRISPYHCERHFETISVWSKSLARCILRLCIVCRENLEKRHMVADIEELEQMDASELHARRLNEKELLTPVNCDNFMFPVADGTVRISWGDQDLRTSTLIWDIPDRGEEQEVLRGESDGLSSPTLLQDDSTRDASEAKNDFWSTTGDFINRHHVEPRVKLYVPRDTSFPISLKYIDTSRKTNTSLDVLLEKSIDNYWNVDGERELSDAWTGFIRFILLNERPPDGFSWSGESLKRKQTTSKPDNAWPDMLKHFSDASKRKTKQKWIIEKPKLDNARQLRVIFFI